MLALVICALAVMLADPVRQLLDQHQQIDKAKAANTALQNQVDQLTAEQQRWDDPDYVRQQARERLFYVMPGDTAYVVVGHTAAGSSRSRATHPAPSATASPAWFDALWSSVQRAGRPAHAKSPRS